MAITSPMDVLRNLAEKQLDDATSKLGQCRQAHMNAVRQHDELVNYEEEYRQQLQSACVNEGISILNLRNYSHFIHALGKAVEQHNGYVDTCQNSVDQALFAWRKNKQRFNAYTTLKARSDAVIALKENRQEQKMMDEYAQRASQRKDVK